MPEYLHPGVYIEETSYRTPPFEGVSTSTAGLVGRTRKGPEGKPTLVTSFTEFVRTFGDPFPIVNGGTPQLGDYLGHAVRAFFDNGGKRAYIVRTLATDASAATSALVTGQAYTLPPNTTVRGPTAVVPLASVRGLDAAAWLDVYARDPNGNATKRTTIQIHSVDVARSTITLTAQIASGLTLPAGGTFFLPKGATLPPGGPTFTAQSRGLDGNTISVQIRPSDLPAMKIVAQRFVRARPQIAAFFPPGNPGPNAGTTIALPSLGVVLPNDRIRLDDTQTVETISSVAFAGAPPPPTELAATMSAAINANAGDAVYLVTRGGVTAGTPALIFKLTQTVTAATADTKLDLEYGLVAMLHAGDVIGIGGTTANVTINAEPDFDPTTYPNTVTVAPPLAAAHPATTISLLDTGEIDAATHTKRLVVADTTGLVTPFVAGTPQTIAITDGTLTIAATVVLVDGSKNVVVVQAAQTIPALWTSFELLQVAGTTDQVSVASTAGFYTGAAVEVFDGSTGSYSVVTAIDPGSRQVTLVPGPSNIVVPVDPNARTAYVRVLEMDVLIYENGALAETFAGLSWNPNPSQDSFRRYYASQINDPDNGSGLVSVAASPPIVIDPTSQPNTPDGYPLALGGLLAGTNGSPLGDTDLIGSDNGPGKRFGIEALKEKSDIALVAVPGVVDESVQQALLTHCELLRYRFAILDGRPKQSDVTAIQAHRGNYDSLYGGYYTPWLKTIDLTTGNTMFAPPCGYVLGICARVDATRGVWKAPANEVVQNILDVELPFTDGEQDVLNPLGINLIRAFETRGIRVWGARTTSTEAEWKYVNVRRLFIFLEHSIDNGTQWVVFEPNNEALWARVKESIESFLFGVWKSGALIGTKPDDAYFVRCDRTTMSQDDIDNGRLVCLIGVAPAYPAEFVIFRIGQYTASTNQA